MVQLPQDRNEILLLSESLKPGGMTRYITLLFRGLLEAGIKPTLITAERPHASLFTKEEFKRVEVFPGLLGGFVRPFLFRRLSAWARERKPALIHGLSGFTATSCQRLAKALDKPFVLSVLHIQEGGSLRVGDHCMRVLACSEAIRENLINQAKVPKELVRVVRLGIPLPELARAVSSQPQDRHPSVVTFAPLTPRRDLGTFLRAARRVLDVRCGACQFLIVGEGPEEPALRKLARELKLEKHVIFSHSAVPYEIILNDADVYVQTPRQQGFGIFVLDAMAHGLPVVATSVGGLIPLVRDGQTGFLVPPGDAEATAKRILDILQDSSLSKSMGQAGRTLVTEQLPYQAMIDRTITNYAEAIGLGPVKGGLTQIVEKSSRSA